MNPLFLIALVFAGLSVFRAVRSRTGWAWGLFGFWILLALALGTGRRVLLVPAAAALVYGLVGRVRLARQRAQLNDWLRRAKAGAERKAAAEVADGRAPEPDDEAPLPEPPGAPVDEWIETEVVLDQMRSYPIEGGATLTVTPGPVRLAFRLRFRQDREAPEHEEVDAPLCTVRLADSEGRLWQSETYLPARAFTAPFEQGSLGVDLTFWDRAPSEWPAALAERCLLAGVVCLLDSRAIYDVEISGETITLQLKYQGPVLDLGWLERPGRIVARVHSLYHRFEDSDGRRESAMLPPFAYTIDPAAVLPLTAPERHWSRWREWWDEPTAEEKLPLRMSATGSMAEPQSTVRVSSP